MVNVHNLLDLERVLSGKKSHGVIVEKRIQKSQGARVNVQKSQGVGSLTIQNGKNSLFGWIQCRQLLIWMSGKNSVARSECEERSNSRFLASVKDQFWSKWQWRALTEITYKMLTTVVIYRVNYLSSLPRLCTTVVNIF